MHICFTFQEIILQKNGQGRMPETISTVTIQNCEYVHITENAFSDLTALTTINLQNIGNLDLDENSFNWQHTIDEYKIHPGIKINIMNTSMEEIPSYAFRGMIHTIYLKNCTVDDVQVFSFASLINTERIDIINTVINNIQAQAFKKFTLNSFTIYSSRLPILPTRTMVDIEVLSELRFEDVDFDVIRTSSIKAHGMQIFRLINNRIVRLEKDSFIVNSKGSIIFQNNLIEDVMTDSLREIKVDKRFLIEDGKQDLTFTNNSIVSFEDNPFSFNTTNFVPRIEQFNILRPCSCIDTKKWVSKNLLSFVSTKDDGTVIKEVIPDVSSLISCKNSNNNYKNNNDLITVKLYIKSVCQDSNFKKYIMILVLVVSIILIALGIIFLVFKNRVKRYINVPTNNSDNKVPYSNAKGNKNPIMIVPEGKTYRETELHVIVEQAEPIEYIPPHKYEK